MLLFFLLLLCDKSSAQPWYNKAVNCTKHTNLFNFGFTFLNDSIVAVDGSARIYSNVLSHLIAYINIHTSDTLAIVITGDSTETYYSGTDNTLVMYNDNVYATGAYQAATAKSKPFLIKIDNNKHFVWQKAYNTVDTLSSSYNNIRVIAPDTIMALGFKEKKLYDADFDLVKLDTAGNILWEKTYGGTKGENGYNFDIIKNKGYILCGYTYSYGAGATDVWLVRIDKGGNVLWTKTMGYSNYDYGYISVLKDGTFLFVGELDDPSTSGKEYAVMKLDSNGNQLWKHVEIFTGNNAFTFGTELQSGLIAVQGWINDASINHTIGFLDLFNQQGEKIAARQFYKVRNAENYLNQLTQMPTGDIMMTGYVFPDGSGNTEDGWLLRTNCIGLFNKPTAHATVVGQIGGVALHNRSQNYYQCYVNWGDGRKDTLSTLSDTIALHQYQVKGDYTISMKSFACGDTATWQQNIFYTSIAEITTTNQPTKIYPNPAQHHVTLVLPLNLSLEGMKLRIYEITGQTVRAENVATLRSIFDITDLENGVYFIDIQNAQGYKYHNKLVVQH